MTGQHPAAGTVARRFTTAVEIWSTAAAPPVYESPADRHPGHQAGAGEGDTGS